METSSVIPVSDVVIPIDQTPRVVESTTVTQESTFVAPAVGQSANLWKQDTTPFTSGYVPVASPVKFQWYNGGANSSIPTQNVV